MLPQQSSPLTKTFQPSSEKACPETGKSGDFVQCVAVQHSSMIASAASPTCSIPRGSIIVVFPCRWLAVLVVLSQFRGFLETKPKTYVVAPPYCRALDAADLCTVAWTWADDGRSRDGYDGRDFCRYLATVRHREDAAEFDGDGVFGDAALLARFNGPQGLLVSIELQDGVVL